MRIRITNPSIVYPESAKRNSDPRTGNPGIALQHGILDYPLILVHRCRRIQQIPDPIVSNPKSSNPISAIPNGAYPDDPIRQTYIRTRTAVF